MAGLVSSSLNNHENDVSIRSVLVDVHSVMFLSLFTGHEARQMKMFLLKQSLSSFIVDGPKGVPSVNHYFLLEQGTILIYISDWTYFVPQIGTMITFLYSNVFREREHLERV